MLKTLSLIGDRITNKNIIWGVGGSLLLNFYNLIDKPNDIDILVDEMNATKLNKMMTSIGKPKEVIRSNPFRTTYFSKYSIEDIDIDIMAGFAIQHNEGVYKLSIQQGSIVAHKKINGVDIPLYSLEDWYILYWLIPNKQEKAILIENYFKTNGIKHPQMLEEALKQSLPLEVKERVISLLS
ncbi:hypothetical protein SAMN05216232_2623 [Virgibacillus subterraneus]|uniref:Nucleotidyl transferase AbiEii toxin, Type IV TA system n=2 Tax=Virgibacillus TaxID=84406 RepID=A0A1H1BZF0_9BACI|nr:MULTISPECIES: hypothetical protein [Virgibacillus]SDQ57150.1 hypothetical protein SAMN05216231_1986 [Virgibacillus salinus]SEQ54168.1 hypothetical protein SAMN05216232_2623 [Virgibacillus subterraneus]